MPQIKFQPNFLPRCSIYEQPPQRACFSGVFVTWYSSKPWPNSTPIILAWQSSSFNVCPLHHVMAKFIVCANAWEREHHPGRLISNTTCSFLDSNRFQDMLSRCVTSSTTMISAKAKRFQPTRIAMKRSEEHTSELQSRGH